MLLIPFVYAQAPSDCEPDRALLAATLLLHGEHPEAGIAALVGGGDPRAVPILADVVGVRRSGPVTEAAVLGLAGFPAALPLLAEWLLDRSLPSGTREAAARALGEARSDAAAATLVAATAHPAIAGGVRSAVLEVLRERYPDRLDSVARVSDSGGVAWVMAAGASGLGYGMATAGHFGETQLVGLGAVAGVAGGATGGWFYARNRPVIAGDAALVTLSEWAGGVGGVLIASGTIPARGVYDPDRVWIGGLVGVAGGATAGALAARAHPGDSGDASEMALMTGVGVATVATTYDFASQGGGGGTTVAGAATLGGFAAFAAASPHVELRGTDLGFIGLGTVWGAVAGGFVPLDPRTARYALPVATAGTAAIIGWGLSPTYDAPGDALLGGWVGLASGTMLGSGLVLLDPSAGTPGWGAVLGGTGGAAAGVALARLDPARIDGTDVLWGGLATGWVTWQTAGWLSHAQTQNAGAIGLTAVGATATAAAVGSRWADVSYGESLTMGSAALWGTYVGGVSAALVQGDTLKASLVGGDIALGLSAVVLVPALDVPPMVVVMADTGGIVLGGSATLVAGLLTDDGNTLLAASLGGAGVGMVTGALVGTRLAHRPPGRMPLPTAALPGDWSLSPMVAPMEGETVYGARVLGVGW